MRTKSTPTRPPPNGTEKLFMLTLCNLSHLGEAGWGQVLEVKLRLRNSEVAMTLLEQIEKAIRANLKGIGYEF